MILCSACLLGVRCRYNGKAKPCDKIIELAKKETIIPICPEQLGGLPTPREACEIKDSRVISITGKDMTESFHRGAVETLKIAKALGINKAVLKQRSPSCGYGQIPDGSFSDKIIKGNGVTADLLAKNSISIITEEEL